MANCIIRLTAILAWALGSVLNLRICQLCLWRFSAPVATVDKGHPEQWLWMHRRWRAIEPNEALKNIVHGAP